MEAVTAYLLTVIQKLTNSFLVVNGESGEMEKVCRKTGNGFQGNTVLWLREYSVACDSLFGLYKRRWFGKDSLCTKQWSMTKSPSRCVYQSQPVFLGCEISFLWLMELCVQPEGHSDSLWADGSFGR